MIEDVNTLYIFGVRKSNDIKTNISDEINKYFKGEMRLNVNMKHWKYIENILMNIDEAEYDIQYNYNYNQDFDDMECIIPSHYESFHVGGKECDVNYRKLLRSPSKNIVHVMNGCDKLETSWSDINITKLKFACKAIIAPHTVHHHAPGWTVRDQGSGFRISSTHYATALHVASPWICLSPNGQVTGEYNCRSRNKVPLSKDYSYISLRYETFPFMQEIYVPVQVMLPPWNTDATQFTQIYYPDVIANDAFNPQDDVVIIEAKDTSSSGRTEYILELAECDVGEDILILGHPKKAIHDIVGTCNGKRIVYISVADQNTLIHRKVITIVRGKITQKSIRETYIYTKSITIEGMSGSPIVKASDPTKVCGMHLRGDKFRNVGITVEHPLFSKYAKKKDPDGKECPSA